MGTLGGWVGKCVGLQITNWHWTPSQSTLHGVNGTFIHHPVWMIENFSRHAHLSRKRIKKKKKKKADQQNIIFTPLCNYFWVQIPNTHRYKELLTFCRHSGPNSSHLTAHPIRLVTMSIWSWINPDNSGLLADLHSVETPPLMGGWHGLMGELRAGVMSTSIISANK